jgi:Na+-driven multidrug efflux pump
MISKLELGITGAGIAILTTELLNFAAFGGILIEELK